jgi:enoyl-[acyl-carrier-protein] reductase (NADH)
MVRESDRHNNLPVLAGEIEVVDTRHRSSIQSRQTLQPEEVANIAIYLASEESNGMTGQTITISGGMRMG